MRNGYDGLRLRLAVWFIMDCSVRNVSFDVAIEKKESASVDRILPAGATMPINGVRSVLGRGNDSIECSPAKLILAVFGRTVAHCPVLT